MNVNIVDFGAVADGVTVNTTAIQSAIDAVSENGGGRVSVPCGLFISGTIRLKSNVELHMEHGAHLKASSDMNDYNPDYVVIGEGKSYSLDTLTKATNLVMKGAKLIGANSDLTGPIENGIAPACRALIAPIELATGKQAYFCGKPNPLMMRTGLNILGCHSAEAVMVGDRMDTDVISGMECGMSTVLVLSGVSSRSTIDTFAYRPTMVLDGVGDIVAVADTQKK